MDRAVDPDPTDDLISLASKPDWMLSAEIKTSVRDLARCWKARDA